MKKALFALFTAFFMVFITLGTMTVSAEPNGTLYGTVFFDYENDWGDVITQPIGGVVVTITRSDGDTRTVVTDANGYYSHTVNFALYESYTVSVPSIPEYGIGEKTYKLYGTSEGATIRPIDKVWGAKQVLINMPAKEVQSVGKETGKIMSQNIFFRTILLRNMVKGLLESFIN